MSKPIAQLRQDQCAELYRMDSLRAKLNAICASARECHSARQNGRLGNLAFDIEVICDEIRKAASNVHSTAEEIRVAEYEAAQREAERDFAPALEAMREIIAGPPTNVIPIRQKQEA